MKKIIFLLISIIALAGCEDMSRYSEHQKYDQGETIPEFFDSQVSSYMEETISGEIECHSGDCPTANFKLIAEEKNCYFCNSTYIRGNRYDLVREAFSSGSSSFSFGCLSKYEGPIMDGFDIIEKTPSIVKVKGEIRYNSIAKSLKCDRAIDPECDDSTYGNCAEEFNLTSIRTVEMTFRPD